MKIKADKDKTSELEGEFSDNSISSRHSDEMTHMYRSAKK